MLMKPKHGGGYSEDHTNLCLQTLVTLVRGLGPWKAGIYLVGGLVPRFLVAHDPITSRATPHLGTTDVDIVLDLELLTKIEAYRKLEQNLADLGFVRGTNDDGRPQYFSWRKSVGGGITIVIDFLCDHPLGEGGRPVSLRGERHFSALNIPGARLVQDDFVEIEITAELLDGRGIAKEVIRVAGIVPFLVLKALAYDDRVEEKDAYDLIYCLQHFEGGPAAVGSLFSKRMLALPEEVLLPRAVEILRNRFATETNLEGYRKDGPVSYARFLADPGRGERDVRNRRDAAAIVEEFLAAVSASSARS